MRVRFLLMFIVVLVLAGCTAVQRTDDQGNLLFHSDGTPATDQEFSAEAAVDAAVVVAPFIGGPWGAAIPILTALIPLFTRKA